MFSNCNVVRQSRENISAIVKVYEWINSNCSDSERAYIIPHTTSYNPDIFKNSRLPDTSLFDKVAYGSAVLGTHAFPTDILDAKYVMTCTPFPPHHKSTNLAEKYNDLFLEIKDSKFKLIESFDMGDGVTFYSYERIIPADRDEVNYYLNAFAEEDSRFPDLFSEVLNKYMLENNL